jgi:hypothetical protein
MVAFGRRHPQRAYRDNDAQPRVGALDISLRTHLLDHLACFRNGLVTVLRDPLMSGAMDAEFGDGHGARLVRP